MGASAHHWRLVVPLLPPDAPLVIVDLPWCATSKRYYGTPDPDGLVTAMASCVAEAWAGPVVIAAHSIGASFAWLMTSQPSITVKGLVPVSGHLFGVSKILRNVCGLNSFPLRLSLASALFRALLPAGKFIRGALDCSSIARYAVLLPFLNPRLISAEDLVGECFRGSGGIGALRLLSLARQVDLLKLVKNSDKPTSVVFGAKDPLLTAGDNYELARIGNIKSVRRVDAGCHFPIIEAPGIVASAIMEQIQE
jgi:pimeloyl-ACP methyl ester carboxylesterase